MISVVSAVRDLARLREISTVLVRHGFGEIVARAGFGRARKPKAEGESVEPPSELDIADDALAQGEAEKKRAATAERLRLVLQDLGPCFIKLGQIASTRTDVLPPDIILELKKLQDDVPPVPFEEIKKVVETSFGKPLDKIYKRFDEKPLATASIGQVHRACLATADGDVEVVVKVQRPNVGNLVLRDVELLHIMAATVEATIPESKLYSPVGLVQQFDRSITAELNYLIEAENCDRFAQNFAGDPNIRFPKAYREATSKQVLTLEFFDGKKLNQAIKEGYDGKLIAKKSVGIIIRQAFDHGFFHADPHPGNIIILGTKEDPVVGLIDVGMVGRLSPELRDRTVDLLMAAVRNDAYGVADALYAIGRPTRKVDMREYRAEVAILAEKYLGKPLKEIDLGAMLRDLVQGAMKYGIEIPPDFMMIGKTLMTLDGIGKELDPDLDIFGEATPFFTELLMKRYSPQRIGNDLMRGVEQLSRAGYDMPLQLREVLDDLRLGRLAVRAPDPPLALATERLGRRVFSGLYVAALTFGGAYLLRGDEKLLGALFLVVGVLVWAGHAFLDWRRGATRL
ncbi:MAG: AarF/UbiB family protein [Polyangiaceae bacterium]